MATYPMEYFYDKNETGFTLDLSVYVYMLCTYIFIYVHISCEMQHTGYDLKYRHENNS